MSVCTTSRQVNTNSGFQKTTGSQLIDRGLPLSQLGLRLWGNEESKVKCLRKKGYFTRGLPQESTSGYITDFVMNHAARSLYPCNSVVWRCDVEGERCGVGERILLLFRCPVGGGVYDLGAVRRRHSGSGEPTAWHYHHSSGTSL